MPSQFGQDMFALQLLGGMRGGFFLDSGAADGVSASNTLLLEASFGWRGICIEPNRALFERLVRNRSCHCVNCCLYTHDGEVEFLESAKMLGGILQEYDPAHLHYARKMLTLPEDPSGRPMTVRRWACTVASVLRKFNAPHVIDYWSLDTEGSELAILKSFPFDQYAFRVLTVEHNRFPSRERLREFLEARGYQRIREFEIDDCYVHPALLSNVATRSHVWTRVGRGGGT